MTPPRGIRVNPDSVFAVARQEFTLRIRKGRWRWLLLAWLLVLFGFTALVASALDTAGVEAQPFRGTIMFGSLMLFVLSLALLVVPAIAAQSINGDRERGVLATLQVTLLSPVEITLGKFLAAWGTSLVFLLLTAPFVLWAYAENGLTLKSIVVVNAVMAILLGAVCAISLGLSALLARSTTSSVLSYLAVFALAVGTLIVFGLSTVVVADDVGYGGGYTERRARPDRVWFMLAPNPFVVLADAAPQRPSKIRVITTPDGETFEIDESDTSFDPLGAIGRAVRDLRVPPDDPPVASSRVRLCVPGEFCGPQETPYSELSGAPKEKPKPVWPTGLTMNLVLAVGALVITTRRLHTPARSLARGQRVA